MARGALLLLLIGLPILAFLLLREGGVDADVVSVSRGTDEREPSTLAEPPPTDDEDRPTIPLRPGAGVREAPRQPTYDELPKGELRVRVLTPDGEKVSTRDVRLRLERMGAAFSHGHVALRDIETETFRYPALVIGKLRVYAEGDHVREGVVEAEVLENRVVEAEVVVEPAGAIHYVASYFDGRQPESVKLTLRRKGEDRPVQATYQVRTPETLTTPRRERTWTQGPDGLILSLAPGTYVLEAVAPDNAATDQTIEVRSGETVDLELPLR